MRSAGLIFLLASASAFGQSAPAIPQLVLPNLTDKPAQHGLKIPGDRPEPKKIPPQRKSVCSVPLGRAKLPPGTEKMPAIKPPAHTGAPGDVNKSFPAPPCDE